ncbi:MAG: transaldolase [Pseudomonadota bacterium]
MHQLDQLREMTCVVADTGDLEAIEQHSPVDATTNPTLLLKAAQLPRYDEIIASSARTCDGMQDLCDRVAVAIGTQILQVIPGRVSTEVDARLSFDIEGMIEKSRRLMALYADAGVVRERVLIKLAATWEGIQAAATLQREDIDCNLTLLFSDVQAVAAGQAKAYLISPFVGRILDWYQGRDPQAPSLPIEADPGVRSVRNIYQLYKAKGIETIVMGASFRNIDQVRALAGCDRLTIAPKLLTALAAEQHPLPRRLHPGAAEAPMSTCECKDEADFRFQLNSNAMATEKLAEGIRGFVADQIALEQTLAERFALPVA